MKTIFCIPLILFSFIARSQSPIDESAIPSTGISYQNGPGSTNTQNWTYKYGVKLSVFGSTARNFEIMNTEKDVNSTLAMRTYNPSITDWTDWREFVFKNPAGQVGIGTSTPTHTLEVIGDALLTDVGGEALLLNPDGNNRRGIVSSNFQLAFIADKVNTYSLDKRIIFGVGGETPDDPNFVTYMILDNGKVGIGTTAYGSHKLAVEGSIGAREIKVEANGWSDFVFAKDYDLPSLEALEAYIHKNKHLPEIPTEVEVTESGINLGEMNAKLLQKIEELTLYLIEEHKQNQLLKQRIEKLEGKAVGTHH